MTKITINERVYKLHPIYDLYAGSEDGYIIHIIKKVSHRGNNNNTGYLMCSVRKHGQSSQKNYYIHRFIWECFNGVIPEGKEIDHINNIKDDNRLCNLQLLTSSENSKKAAENRDYSLTAEKFKNRRCVKPSNHNTGEVLYFYSIYATEQHLGINRGIIRMVCDGVNYRKSGISKKDGQSYSFEYIKEEDLPKDHKKSANKRPRKASDEEKKKHRLEWWNKEYKCPRCGTVTKNNSKYRHIKKCNSQQ